MTRFLSTEKCDDCTKHFVVCEVCGQSRNSEYADDAAYPDLEFCTCSHKPHACDYM